MRIGLLLSYNGFLYHGWQSQRNKKLITIQDLLQAAISRVADHPVDVICAGRTDKGVHAVGQVIHFDTHAERESHNWVLGVNSNLPADIRVINAKVVPDDFHARFSALARSYRYIIYNNLTPSAILHQQTTWHYKTLNVEQMHLAAQHLVGEHDFSSYRAAECQARSPVRTIHSINVQQKNKCIILDIKANGFLHHMVRNIVGVLMLIGEGKREPHWSLQVLQAKNRSAGAITAPPNGLYFINAFYPDYFDLFPANDDLFLTIY